MSRGVKEEKRGVKHVLRCIFSVIIFPSEIMACVTERNQLKAVKNENEWAEIKKIILSRGVKEEKRRKTCPTLYFQCNDIPIRNNGLRNRTQPAKGS